MGVRDVVWQILTENCSYAKSSICDIHNFTLYKLIKPASNYAILFFKYIFHYCLCLMMQPMFF